MEQANAINNVAANAFKEGYNRGYKDGLRKDENFLDNADKAHEAEKDREAVEETGDMVKQKNLWKII